MYIYKSKKKKKKKISILEVQIFAISICYIYSWLLRSYFLCVACEFNSTIDSISYLKFKITRSRISLGQTNFTVNFVVIWMTPVYQFYLQPMLNTLFLYRSRLGCQIVMTKELDGIEVKVPATINDARAWCGWLVVPLCPYEVNQCIRQ